MCRHVALPASEGSLDPSASRTDSTLLLLRPHHVANAPDRASHEPRGPVLSVQPRFRGLVAPSPPAVFGLVIAPVVTVQPVPCHRTRLDRPVVSDGDCRRRCGTASQTPPECAVSGVFCIRTFEWYAQLELDAIGSVSLDAPAGSDAGQGEQEEEFFVLPESSNSWDRYERYPVPSPHQVEAMRAAVGMGSRSREENDEDEQPNHSTLSSDMTLRGANLGMRVHGRPHSFDEGFYDAPKPSLVPSSAHVAPRRHHSQTVSYFSAERCYPARTGSPSRTSEYSAAEWSLYRFAISSTITTTLTITSSAGVAEVFVDDIVLSAGRRNLLYFLRF
ncbi:hypothetical protein HDU96_001346 [Phlyctochytrium bullatum]|nr:hypothetical protein HDU96_001346 [Phlyctochytrium bullatum]